MTNGSSTGLVATDASYPVDVETGSVTLGGTAPIPTAKQVADVHDWLVTTGEWQAARALVDAWAREKGKAREG